MFVENFGPQHEPCDSGLHRCAVSVGAEQLLQKIVGCFEIHGVNRQVGTYNTGSIFDVEQESPREDIMGGKAQEFENTPS